VLKNEHFFFSVFVYSILVMVKAVSFVNVLLVSVSGSVVAQWIPERARAVLLKSREPIVYDPYGEPLTDTNEDLFSTIKLTRTQSILRTQFQEMEGMSSGTFRELVTDFGLDDDFCNSFVDRFFIRRPHWFVPTRTEVLRARECYDRYLEVLSVFCEEKTDACTVFVEALEHLGLGLYSRHTEWALRLAPMESFACASHLTSYKDSHPRIQEHINSINIPPVNPWDEDETDDKLILRMLSSGSPESVVHASDFLDRYGMEPYTLPLWEAFLAVPFPGWTIS
jgi:hypothetical protein